MTFIKLFLRKETSDVTKGDIDGFISRKVEENLNLDYKDIRAYHDFVELSKDISAFANSEGGLVLLGVSEKKIKKNGVTFRIFPGKVTWGSATLSRERLEDNLIGKIHPRIDGLMIVPIRRGNGSSQVIFVIDIPQSIKAPHMASDSRYHKRLNFRRVPMEHYEVADLFGKRRKPIVTLLAQITNVKIEEEIYTFTLQFLLRNVGKAIAKYVHLTASFANVELQKIPQLYRRLDTLRQGIPSIQFDMAPSVLYPKPGKTAIGELTLKVKDNSKPIIIHYDLAAEHADYSVKKLTLTVAYLIEAKHNLEQGKHSLDFLQ